MGKWWFERIPIGFGIWGWVLATAWAGSTSDPTATNPEVAAAIQAIQQAPDPSATVAAYVNGAAVDRNDPKLSEAYVARMVDLGLPELAFRQAQALTTRESNNGLAWGVIAYVEARRGNMSDAISAINLAGQLAPDNLLVERTAGEIIAWYDVKADKASLSDNAKNGLSTIRGVLGERPEFANAYETAKKAYKAEASVIEQPAHWQSIGVQTTAAPGSYYPDYYYYASGADWVEPAPWWWWQPVGFFGGFDFFPFATVVVFNHHNFFRHHDRFFHKDPDGRFFHGNNVVVNHSAGSSRGTFFGMSARPNPSMAGSRLETFPNTSMLVAINPLKGGSLGLPASRMGRRFGTSNMGVQRNVGVGPSMAAPFASSSRSQIVIASTQQFSSTPQVSSMGRAFGPTPGSATFRMSAQRVFAGGGHRGGFRGGRR